MSTHDIIMGAAGASGGATNYIENVFSTYLYTGNGTSQTINNGIDLSTKGGFVWIKDRTFAYDHRLYDTARGVGNTLYSNTTGAQDYIAQGLTAFNTNGFSVGSNGGVNSNSNSDQYVSWTFRKQPKFFDVVTYTGNGSAPRAISHSLGSTPGCIIIKKTSGTGNWWTFHRSAPNQGVAYPNIGGNLYLDTTDAADSGANPFLSAVDSTTFTLSTNQNSVMNANGATYVAYIFAHNAGGFGLTGTDNVISCGSYVGNGSTSGPTVTLGYEPQWLMVKKTSNATNSNWFIVDNMRGFTADGSDTTLYPNLSNAEGLFNPAIAPTATGFQILNTGGSYNESGSTYIYIAIRRGPMKVPTDGTKVFQPYTTAASTGTAVTTNFPVDFQLYKYRAGIDYGFDVDRLRGVNSTTTGNSTPWLDTTATTAEASATNVSRNWGNTGFEVPGIVGGASNVFYSFQRAPSFFDEVCMDGDSTANKAHSHNLGVEPELVICKDRTGSSAYWTVYAKPLGLNQYLVLNRSDASAAYSLWGPTAPTSTNIYFQDTVVWAAAAGNKGVMYLFASCPGVSKVGSYTGNGSSQTINCGFAAGARFVMIKRTDSTGDWYVWDTARGIVSGNDPYLLLNSTAAEVTITDYIDPYSAGFELSSTALTTVNVLGGTYIYLAIA